MSRINTNVQSMVAQHVLARQNQELTTSLQRLSTGVKINAGKDNPAGLIASENLRSEKAGLSQAITNAERADSLIGTAEGALNEVSSLLVQLQTLVTDTANDGGLTTEEKNANQAQVDAILSSINRIAASTQFGSKKLLDGSLDYTTDSVDTSDLAKVQVNSARLVDGVDKSVQVQVTAAAEYGELVYTGDTVGSSDVTVEIAGSKGSEIISLSADTTTSAAADAINALKDVTGVSAVVSAAVGSGGSDVLVFYSTGYGSDSFVSVDAVDGTFATKDADGNDATRDAGADPTVLINGQAAEAQGLSVSLRTATLDVDLTLTSTFGGATGSSTFDITGGGANFQIGSEVTNTSKASIGIGSVSTGSLGNETVGYLASLATGGTNSLTAGSGTDAQDILTQAVAQVSNLRGRLGAFQKFTLGPTINALQVAMENTSAAESAVRDTDFAAETSNLTRSQILSKAATNVLALANSLPQSVLSLLG
ncbi:MAG: Flagellin [Phycisphaerae bacterium]|nr:Flagellin [Phycisphaerae bacterium]